jgi:hypothetical protein
LSAGDAKKSVAPQTGRKAHNSSRRHVQSVCFQQQCMHLTDQDPLLVFFLVLRLLFALLWLLAAFGSAVACPRANYRCKGWCKVNSLYMLLRRLLSAATRCKDAAAAAAAIRMPVRLLRTQTEAAGSLVQLM